MNTLYLIRHGDIANPDDVLYLHMELQLTEWGRQQAKLAAEYLRPHSPTVMYSSPLIRTKETSEIIAQELQLLPVNFDSRLLEVNNPPLQGLTFTEYRQKWQGNLYHPELELQGAETIQQIWHRMSSALTDFCQQHPDQTIAVVSHGDPLKITWLGMASLPLTPENIRNADPSLPAPYPEKGSVTTVEYNGNKFLIQGYWEPQK